jgi:hypothetical protein
MNSDFYCGKYGTSTRVEKLRFEDHARFSAVSADMSGESPDKFIELGLYKVGALDIDTLFISEFPVRVTFV